MFILPQTPGRRVVPARQVPAPRIALLGLIWLIAAAFQALSAETRAGNVEGPYEFDVFGREVGLPHSTVVAALQTRDGYLWVATEGGLGRFDGVRCLSFTHSNTPAIMGHAVLCLDEDSAGNLWIGTDRGLVRYRSGKFERIGLDDIEVNALAHDRLGKVWIGTVEHGLYSWQNGEFQHYKLDPTPPENLVHCLYVDSSDRLWIGFNESKDVVCFERGVFRHYNGAGRLKYDVWAVCEAPRGTLWLGTNGGGLLRLKDNQLTFYSGQDGLASPVVSDLKAAKDGGLWIVAGVLQKISRLNEVAFTTVGSGPADANLTAVCEDREGDLWLSAREDGLVRFRAIPFKLLSSRTGLPQDVITSASEDNENNVWVTTFSKGCASIAPDGTVSRYAANQGFPTTDYHPVLLAARDGSIWFGSDKPLWVWKNGTGQSYPNMIEVCSFFQDHAGRIWLGTWSSGTYRYENKQFIKVRTKAGLEIPSALTFSEGPDGAVYIGTWQCGIFVIKGGDVQVLNQDKGLPNDAVRAVYADKEGNLWVGMKDQGLAVLSRGRWWSPGELTEEVTEFVSAIAEDDQGRLVVGTSSGIKWAPKDQLLAAARGERAVPVFRTIGGEEGRSLAVWWGGDPIVWKAHDHTLYFATRRGLVVLDPARILENTVLPPVYIERVLVDGKPAGDGRKIDLPAGARDLTIEYTALSLPQPGSVLFKCKLNGYDKDWVNVGNRRSQSYDNLPPGNYVFQVQACNNDGRWNRRGDRIEIAQRPYFYQTGWFYGVVVGCVAGAAWWGHRYSQRQLQFKLERLEHKQAMEKERQRIARNLHDDLGAHLTEIGLFVERTKQKTPSPDAAKNLGSLSDRVRALTGALDAVVWAVDPANDSLDQLALYICGMLEDLFRLSPIRSRLDVAPDIPACPLTPEIRSNLFLTAKEAMNNVLKHSGATEVWLRIGLENDCFRMAIEDNGCGFDLSAVGRAKRNGLSNMKSRIEEMGGEFAVQSTLGQGTSVAMAVRLAGKRKV